MSNEMLALLPQMIMLLAGGLFFLGGRILGTQRLWGPLCLAVLAVAAASLSFANPAAQKVEPAVPQSTRARATESSSLEPEQAKPSDPEVLRSPRSLFICWLAVGLGFLFTLAALETQSRSAKAAEFFALLLIGVAGVMIAGMANDLIVLLLAVETVGFSTGLLVFISHDGLLAREAAAKHFLLQLLSTVLVLLGLALVYGLSGSTRLTEIGRVLTASYASHPPLAAVGGASRLGVVAIGLLVAGLGFRLSLAPFQFGQPDVCQGSTAWSTGWLAAVPKVAAFIAVIRLLSEAMVGFESAGELMVLVVAAVAMTVGSTLALFETNVGRIIAYTVAAHVGFATIGIGVGFWDAAHPQHSLAAGRSLPGGIVAGLFYLTAFSISIAGMCILLSYLTRRDRRIEYLDDLSGLIRSEPLAACCALVFLLSLAGVPPFPGFWGRLLVLSSAYSVLADSPRALLPGPHSGFLLLGVVAAAAILMTAALCLRILVVMFVEPQIAAHRPGGGQSALGAALLAAILIVGGGLLPGPILGFLKRSEATEIPAALRTTASRTESTARPAWLKSRGNFTANAD